ncbi:hypothetical protein EDB84DRAFT_1572981 [Lactarius hengduanensis]|nr:hypothetical protein EDB84DRAFT_1572981 [Lactarius hengduanensis]
MSQSTRHKHVILRLTDTSHNRAVSVHKSDRDTFVPDELQDAAATPSHVLAERQGSAAPEPSHVLTRHRKLSLLSRLTIPDALREAAAPEPFHVPDASPDAVGPEALWDAVAPEPSHVLSASRDTAAPGSSHVPDTSQEAAVPEQFHVPDASRDAVAPELSHVPDASRDAAAPEPSLELHTSTRRTFATAPRTPDSSDSEQNMDTDSIQQDEIVASDPLERDTFPLIYPPRVPYPELRSARHFTATYRRLLALDPSDHMGDLIERTTILMGIILDFHTDLSYIRDGLSKHRQSQEQKTTTSS